MTFRSGYVFRPDLLDVLLFEPSESKFSIFEKNLQVLPGNSVLFGLTIVNCSPEETFGNVYNIKITSEERFCREENGESEHQGQQASP